MTEIGFYHLQRTTLAEALPRLLEKALAAGHRVLVKTANDAEAERLSLALWTYGEGSFLPHGTARDGWAAEQPVFLTAGDDNPNRAGLLCQAGGAEAAAPAGFARVVDMFDGNDQDAVTAARARWQRYQAEGHALSYWQQQPNGGWAKRS